MVRMIVTLTAGLMAVGAVACSGGPQTGEPTTTTAPPPAAIVGTTVPVGAGTVPVSEAPAPVDDAPVPAMPEAAPVGPGAAPGGGAKAAAVPQTPAQAAARAEYDRARAEIEAARPDLLEHAERVARAQQRMGQPLTQAEVNERARAAMADPSKQVPVLPAETTTVPATVPPPPGG
jgi:hypothetical protein